MNKLATKQRNNVIVNLVAERDEILERETTLRMELEESRKKATELEPELTQ